MGDLVLKGATSGQITMTPTAIAGTNTLTVPAATDTIVCKNTTDTLTNKTLTSPIITGASISSMASSVITSGTTQASTSGTSIDFTGIPSWVKRVTVMFYGVSLSGTDFLLVQQGAGSITTSGYLAYGSYSGATNAAGGYNSTSGHVIGIANAGDLLYGNLVLTYMGSNMWVSSHSAAITVAGSYYAYAGGGSVTLSGTMDRVRITPSGSNTFDAGSINILYE